MIGEIGRKLADWTGLIRVPNQYSENELKESRFVGAIEIFDMTNTFMAKKEEVQPQWFVVDADAQIVGRLATKIATVLMGKHKPTYTPHASQRPPIGLCRL